MTSKENLGESEQLSLPLARVMGEVITETPKGLYIPPNALKVLLTDFEGPLDLLSYLIRSNKFDVRDIPVFEVARQYQEYIHAMQELDIELAGEYLFMAAWLAEIKSRMLLPRPPVVDDEEEQEDPRAELVQRLLEYESYQQTALWLDSLKIKGRDFWKVSLPVVVPDLEPNLEISELESALQAVLQRAVLKTSHQISEEPLEIGDKIGFILDRVSKKPVSLFGLLIANEGRVGVVVTFIAMLELLRQGKLKLEQQEEFGDILVSR